MRSAVWQPALRREGLFARCAGLLRQPDRYDVCPCVASNGPRNPQCASDGREGPHKVPAIQNHGGRSMDPALCQPVSPPAHTGQPASQPTAGKPNKWRRQALFCSVALQRPAVLSRRCWCWCFPLSNLQRPARLASTVTSVVWLPSFYWPASRKPAWRYWY